MIARFGGPLAVLVASRVLVALSGRFAARHLPVDPLIPTSNIGAPAWFRWDALAYLRIATEGYVEPVSATWFPLYPLLGSTLAKVTGLPTSLALLVVSNAAFAAAGLLMFDLVEREFGRSAAFVAVATLAFFPTTVFLSAGYAESVFLLLSVVVFRFLSARRIWWAAAFAGLGSVSRPFGWILAVPVVIEASRNADPMIRRTVRCVSVGLLSWAGLIAYAGYLGVRFGRPLQFATAHAEWHGHVDNLLVAYLPWSIAIDVAKSGSREQMVYGVVLLGFLVLLALTCRRIPLRYSAFALVACALMYARTPYVIADSPRHVLALVPTYVSFAALFERRIEYGLAVVLLFAGMSVFWTALYFQGYPIR